MPTLEIIATLAATISATKDLIDFGGEYFDHFKQRKSEIDKNGLPPAVVKFFNSYSDKEIESFKEAIDGCRERAMMQGGGESRRKCLCSVLHEIQAGNNGFPLPEWEEMYTGLGCEMLFRNLRFGSQGHFENTPKRHLSGGS